MNTYAQGHTLFSVFLNGDLKLNKTNSTNLKSTEFYERQILKKLRDRGLEEFFHTGASEELEVFLSNKSYVVTSACEHVVMTKDYSILRKICSDRVS